MRNTSENLHDILRAYLSPTMKASLWNITLPSSLYPRGTNWNWMSGCDMSSLLRIKPPASLCAVAHGPALVRNHFISLLLESCSTTSEYGKASGAEYTPETREQWCDNLRLHSTLWNTLINTTYLHKSHRHMILKIVTNTGKMNLHGNTKLFQINGIPNAWQI